MVSRGHPSVATLDYGSVRTGGQGVAGSNPVVPTENAQVKS